MNKEKVVDVEVYLLKGEVRIFEKGVFLARAETAKLKDIGRAGELVELLKKYGYPVVIYE